MDRDQLLEMWNDMWREGNWVPSWPDSLAGLSAEQAAWSPNANCHSVWQETVHVIFWRQVTLGRWEGKPGPTDEEIAKHEFASPETVSETAWAATVAMLQQTQEAVAAAIQDSNTDVTRVRYHLIHDPYHLGRITQIRSMQGTAPKF